MASNNFHFGLFIILMLIARSGSAKTPVDPRCVVKLASAPYCLTVASARSNCEKGSVEADHIAACMKPIIEKTAASSMQSEVRHTMYVLCLVDEKSGTNAQDNQSLCRPAAAPKQPPHTAQ